MKLFRTHIRAYQTVSEKQTGIPAGLLPVRAIYAWNERLQPPDYVPVNRYRTYSTEVTSLCEQSPASTHTRALAHAQLIYQSRYQKSRKNFVQNVEILLFILCNFYNCDGR